MRRSEVPREIERYQAVVRDRPELFTQNDALSIVLNPDEMMKCSKHFNRPVGVVYESPWTMVLVDVVFRGDSNRTFPYERIIHTSNGEPVVMVPRIDDKFVLLKQFRHSIRRFQFAFPRGYGENGLIGEQNARKELHEELGADVVSLKSLGAVCADSGLSGAIAAVYLCDISDFKTSNSEGIADAFSVSSHELEQMIASGEIDDGFTLSAWSLLKAHSAS